MSDITSISPLWDVLPTALGGAISAGTGFLVLLARNRKERNLRKKEIVREEIKSKSENLKSYFLTISKLGNNFQNVFGEYSHVLTGEMTFDIWYSRANASISDIDLESVNMISSLYAENTKYKEFVETLSEVLSFTGVSLFLNEGRKIFNTDFPAYKSLKEKFNSAAAAHQNSVIARIKELEHDYYKD